MRCEALPEVGVPPPTAPSGCGLHTSETLRPAEKRLWTEPRDTPATSYAIKSNHPLIFCAVLPIVLRLLACCNYNFCPLPSDGAGSQEGQSPFCVLIRALEDGPSIACRSPFSYSRLTGQQGAGDFLREISKIALISDMQGATHLCHPRLLCLKQMGRASEERGVARGAASSSPVSTQALLVGTRFPR